jgi:hydroxypyruvate isomerase
MRLSANLGFLWPDLPLLDRIAAAGLAGFAAVELHWPYDIPAAEIRRAADAAGVRVLALNSLRGDVAAGEAGLACLPGREGQFRDTVALAFDYARVLGAGAVHVMAGKPQGDGWRDALIANLRHACDTAGDLTVLIEPLNTTDNPGYAYATVDQAQAIRAAVDRPNLRLMFDAYHVAMMGQDPAAVWLACRADVGHVQFAGVPGRAEPSPDAPPLRAFFETLRAEGYSGWIGAEYRPAGATEAGLGWRDRIPGG